MNTTYNNPTHSTPFNKDGALSNLSDNVNNTYNNKSNTESNDKYNNTTNTLSNQNDGGTYSLTSGTTNTSGNKIGTSEHTIDKKFKLQPYEESQYTIKPHVETYSLNSGLNDNSNGNILNDSSTHQTSSNKVSDVLESNSHPHIHTGEKQLDKDNFYDEYRSNDRHYPDLSNNNSQYSKVSDITTDTNNKNGLNSSDKGGLPIHSGTTPTDSTFDGEYADANKYNKVNDINSNTTNQHTLNTFKNNNLPIHSGNTPTDSTFDGDYPEESKSHKNKLNLNDKHHTSNTINNSSGSNDVPIHTGTTPTDTTFDGEYVDGIKYHNNTHTQSKLNENDKHRTRSSTINNSSGSNNVPIHTGTTPTDAIFDGSYPEGKKVTDQKQLNSHNKHNTNENITPPMGINASDMPFALTAHAESKAHEELLDKSTHHNNVVKDDSTNAKYKLNKGEKHTTDDGKYSNVKETNLDHNINNNVNKQHNNLNDSIEHNSTFDNTTKSDDHVDNTTKTESTGEKIKDKVNKVLDKVFNKQ